MNAFKAAVLCELGSPLEIKFITPNTPLKKGQVFVKLIFSGICRSQLMEQEGKRGQDKWLPHLLGHEGVGKVVEVGPEVKKLKVDDYVVASWIKTSGINAEPAKYRSIKDNKIINGGNITTFSEYSIISENRLFKKPDTFNLKTATLLGCALPTGAGMVLNEGKPKIHQKILLIGLGGIGLSALITLIMQGIKNIDIVEKNENKLKIAKSLGVTGKLFQNAENLKYSNHYDICFESSGQIKMIEKGFSCINTKGKLIFASHPPQGQFINLDPHELIKGKRIFGTWGGGSKPDHIAEKLTELRSLRYLENLLGRTYELENINEALNELKNNKEVRPIIKM